MATQAEIEALAVRKEIEANLRAQAAGFPDAAARERDANRRSIEAGFTSAVDQEIDANRRAREAGFENAALQENPAAAAPGESIYSTAPFVDPRTPVSLGTFPTAPRLPARGVLNTQPAPVQGGIWGPPIQAGGGYGQFGEYLVPPQYTGPTSTDPYVMQSSMGPGWGYQYPINPNGMIRGFGGGGPGGYPGGYPGGGGGVLGPIGPGTGAAAGGTKYPGVITGSDKEQDLDAGRTHHVEMYDANDMWIGAEGTPMGDETRDILGATQYSGGNIGVNAPTNQEWASEMAQKNAVVDHNTLASSWGPITAHSNLASSWGPYAAANQLAQNVNKTFMEQFSPTETTTMGPINLNVPLSPASTPFQEVATAQNMGVNQGLIDQAAQQRYMSSLDDEQARNMRAMAQGRNIGQVMRDMQAQQALANLSAAGGMEFGGGGILGEIDPNIDISPGGTVNVRGQ